MNLENDLEFRDSIKKIKIKLNSAHKMRALDLIEQGIIILKEAAKTLRDTNDNTEFSK